MIQTQDKIINGSTYTVTQLPARRALKMKARLIKLFGPSMAQFFLSSDKKSDDGFVKAIEKLSLTIDENSFEMVAVELLNGVRKDGVELNPQLIDMEFAGDFDSLYKVLWFVIEANYSNFFSLIGIGSQSLPENKQSDATKKTYT